MERACISTSLRSSSFHSLFCYRFCYPRVSPAPLPFSVLPWAHHPAVCGNKRGPCVHCRILGNANQPLGGQRRRFLLKAAGVVRFACWKHWPVACISSVVTAGVGGGGGGFGGGASNGGGGGGDDGFKSKASGAQPVGAVSDETSSSRSSADDVIILDVGGMSCGSCASSVKKILESQPQVTFASVNLATETAIVRVLCQAEVSQVWHIVKRDLGEALARHLTSCGFKSSVREQGCANGGHTLPVPIRKREERKAHLKELGRRLVVACALTAVCLVGHTSHLLGKWAPSWICLFHSTGFQMSLSLAALVGPGQKLLIDGWKSLWRGSPNMNTLVGLGAISSFTVSAIAALFPTMGWKSFFEEPVMLLAFVLLGRTVEERAKLQSSSDMTSLLKFLPSKACLVVGDYGNSPPTTVEVPCESLAVGDRVLVLPGDRIPVDGMVRAGKSTVDESSLSGEPLPVLKNPGDEVGAGSLNYNGTIVVEALRAGGETVLGDIVHMVEDAQSRQAPVQRLADKVAGHFCYGVMGLSTATFAFWNFLGPQIFPSAIPQGGALLLALQLACNVLVIACPCALGLATPTAVLVGTSLGARRGLLIRGGDILEKASLVDTVVFDKTGTLTVGRPLVTCIVANSFFMDAPDLNDSPGADPKTGMRTLKDSRCIEKELLALAAGVEATASHPIAQALVDAATVTGCRPVMVKDGTFEQEPGCGATAVVEGRRVTVGTVEWVRRHGAAGEPPDIAEALEGQTVVYVGMDNMIIGAISMADRVRDDAANTVQALHKMGVDIQMLSGDKQVAAEAVAAQVGIANDKVYGGVSPYGKVECIVRLQKNGRTVAMVGDGINDAAALAQSDVGIAMVRSVGAAGEAASIVLTHNKLLQVVDAIELSRMTLKKIQQNLWWAFLYNIVGLPVAAGILLPSTGVMLTPSLSGALMGISSLGVMANSLLLKVNYSRQHPFVVPTTHPLRANESMHSNSELITSFSNQLEEDVERGSSQKSGKYAI